MEKPQDKIIRYTVMGVSGLPWEQHLPLGEARKTAAHIRGEGFLHVLLVAEPSDAELAKPAMSSDETDEYSVWLNGMTLWDDHLRSVSAARYSAEEPRAMGLADVHIIDDSTGEMLE